MIWWILGKEDVSSESEPTELLLLPATVCSLLTIKLSSGF